MKPIAPHELARTPSPEAWAKITAAADALTLAEMSEGLADLEGALAIHGWSPDPARRWWSSMTAWRMKDGASWVSGELRRAPLSWVRDILDGAHAPKHALARALSLEGTKTNATKAARIFDSPHLGALRVLDAGRDVKLAPAFYKKLASAKNLGALETVTYYPLALGGGKELAAASNLGALRHLNLRAIVYSTDNLACTADVEELFRAPWISQIETLESSMGQSTGWSRFASIYRPLREHSARLTSLRRLILSDTSELDDLVAAPVLDQVEELVIQVENERALRAVMTKLDARGLPRLGRLDVSQQRVVSTQKKDGFEPLSDKALRAIVAPTTLAKQVGAGLIFALP